MIDALSQCKLRERVLKIATTGRKCRNVFQHLISIFIARGLSESLHLSEISQHRIPTIWLVTPSPSCREVDSIRLSASGDNAVVFDRGFNRGEKSCLDYKDYLLK